MNTVPNPDEVNASREEMIRQLKAVHAIRSPAVEDAFRRVPRHTFMPEVGVQQAYGAERALVTKRDENGVSLSSVSAARVQAFMLEQAAVQPGHRVLEIGSGGVNAAYLAELVGPKGVVTTVDIDPDVVDRARRLLQATGYEHVRAVVADAEAGLADDAPFDSIVVTVEAADLAPAWVDQLAAGGRIVVPLRLRGLTRSVAMAREGDHLLARDAEVCGFVPMRGAGETQQHLVVLHDDARGSVGIRLDGIDADPDALRAAFDQVATRVEAWSGVTLATGHAYDGLDLWLATALDEFALMAATREARQSGLVASWSPMGIATVIDRASFAYLCMRPTSSTHEAWEFGAVGHGPGAEQCADRLIAEMRTWDRFYRTSQAEIRAYPTGTPDAHLRADRVVDRRNHRFTISWPHEH